MTATPHYFKYDVFISYARKDGAVKAKSLKTEPEKHSLGDNAKMQVYLDTAKNEAGNDWWRKIEDSIIHAKCFVFIITERSVKSEICQKEWEVAQNTKIPILPIKVVDSDDHIIKDLPLWCNYIHYIDTTEDWLTGAEEIIRYLTRYDYLYSLRNELSRLVSESTAKRFIEIIATENAEAKKQLKRCLKVRTLQRQVDNTLEFSSFDKAWRHYDGQVLLLGAPGAGKTTTLLHHAQTLVSNYLADRNQPVPVFASIAYWDSYKDVPLHEWLPEENDLSEDVRRVIENGKAILILDGLDELGSSKPINPKNSEEGTFDPRLRFLRQVQNAINDGNQILMTCRVADYQEIGEKLQIRGAIELQPLADEQIETYLGDVPTVQKTVMLDADLLNICRSPLLLSLIAFGYRDAPDELKSLPSMDEGDLRDAIFEHFIKASYQFETQRRRIEGAEIPFTFEQVLDGLGHAAMINVCGTTRNDALNTIIFENVVTQHDFTHRLKDHYVEKFIKFIETLKIIETYRNKNYKFVHLLMRDYLAYQFSIKHIEDGNLYRPFKSGIKRLIGSGLHPIVALGKLRDCRAIFTLVKNLENSETYIRRQVTRALSQFSNDEVALITLLDLLITDPNSNVRKEAGISLRNFDNERMIDTLLQSLETDENSDVRFQSLHSLRIAFLNMDLDKQKLLQIYMDVINTDPSNVIKVEALELLGNIEDVTVVDFILQIMLTSRDKYVVKSSSYQLLRLRDKRAVEPLIQTLNRFTDSDLKETIINILGEFKDERAVTPLIQILQQEEERWFHIDCIIALGEIGSKRAIPALATFLTFKGARNDLRLAHYAARAMSNIDDEEAQEYVNYWHRNLWQWHTINN